jgi:hypothetical protein
VRTTTTIRLTKTNRIWGSLRSSNHSFYSAWRAIEPEPEPEPKPEPYPYSLTPTFGKDAGRPGRGTLRVELARRAARV